MGGESAQHVRAFVVRPFLCPLAMFQTFLYNGKMRVVRAIMLGDVVGEPGIKALEEGLPGIIEGNSVSFVVANGENAADGFGLTDAALRRIFAAGVDVVTSGNHVWEKREFWQTLETDDKVLRPANYPGEAAGRGWLCAEKDGVSWVVINVQGRELLPLIDCPFRCFDNIIKNVGCAPPGSRASRDDSGDSVLPNACPIVLVDFHAESTREKEALAYYIDGRASLLAGTHTHVQTADERVLPQGTAYITDLGMTGISDSVIGMDPDICMERARKQVLYRMEPAADRGGGNSGVQIQGIIAEIRADTGKAVSVSRL